MKDRNGKELEVGDVVFVPCVVEHIGISDDWANTRLRTRDPMFPGQYRAELNLNSRQLEFVSRNEAPAPVEPEWTRDPLGLGDPAPTEALPDPEE
jgi:hypothetical protein